MGAVLVLGGIWEIVFWPHFWPLDIGVRAAGALILLFGLQLQRIRHLTADQITEKDSNTYPDRRPPPLLLPPRLGALLSELAAQPATRLIISHGPDAPAGYSGPGPRPARLGRQVGSGASQVGNRRTATAR
jgi:hypothetical protein